MDLLKLLGTFNQECSHTESIHESSFVERTANGTETKTGPEPAVATESADAPMKGVQSKGKVKTDKGYRTIVQCILTNFDPLYQAVPTNERRLFLKQRTMDLGTQIEENPVEFYHPFGFNSKVMKPKLIQLSFQLSLDNKNTLASILYLNRALQEELHACD